MPQESPTQDKVYSFIKKEKIVSTLDIQEHLGCTKQYTYEVTKKLAKKGKIIIGKMTQKGRKSLNMFMIVPKK